VQVAAIVTAVHGSPDVEDVFRAHYGRLVRALTVVSGDREVAADAVQEAFVKAHVRWRKVSRMDDPVGWIRRVAINSMRDQHRRRGRKQRALDRLAGRAAEVVDAPPEPGGHGELRAGIAALPRQRRLAIALFYLDGLSVAEIAGALGISDGAVKFHLHAGRQQLREILATDGGRDE
jgi:RNA polymerase sigma-70 factor (ECF subfamily)